MNFIPRQIYRISKRETIRRPAHKNLMKKGSYAVKLMQLGKNFKLYSKPKRKTKKSIFSRIPKLPLPSPRTCLGIQQLIHQL